MQSFPVVSIQKIDRPISDVTIDSAVERAVSLACDGQELIRKGDRVVIKPNIFAPAPPPTVTDPRTVAALVRYAYKAGAGEVIVAEGRSISTAKFRKKYNSTQACAELIGMPAAVEAAGGKMVYLEDEEFVEVDVPGGVILQKAHVPRIILETDVLISVPAMKIHSLAHVTLGIKNLHGLLVDDDKLYGHSYRELPSKLCDFLRVRTLDLTLIDGIVAQEADHAEEGRPVDMGLFIAGRDVVAVDAVTTSVMGFEPCEVETTRFGGEYGLGESDLAKIRVAGETIESVRRPFVRADIALNPALFPGLKIFAGDYCKSCEYYTRRGLDKLVEAGVLDGGTELSIVIGKEPEVPNNIPGKVIMIGDCCLASKSVRRLRDHLLLDGRLQVVYACPPMQFRIRALDLVGE